MTKIVIPGVGGSIRGVVDSIPTLRNDFRPVDESFRYADASFRRVENGFLSAVDSIRSVGEGFRHVDDDIRVRIVRILSAPADILSKAGGTDLADTQIWRGAVLYCIIPALSLAPLFTSGAVIAALYSTL